MFKYHSQSVTAAVVWQNVHHMAVIDRASVIFTVVFVLVCGYIYWCSRANPFILIGINKVGQKISQHRFRNRFKVIKRICWAFALYIATLLTIAKFQESIAHNSCSHFASFIFLRCGHIYNKNSVILIGIHTNRNFVNFMTAEDFPWQISQLLQVGYVNLTCWPT